MRQRRGIDHLGRPLPQRRQRRPFQSDGLGQTSAEGERVPAPRLTVASDQCFIARIQELIEQANALLDRVGILAKRNAVARDMAHGEQRCLEIAMALACEPRLLLLDEPTAGMSPEETVKMMDLIVRLATERTVILVEHKMKLVMGICQQLVVLHHGELLAQGTPDDIRANDEVKRVYLGQGKT